jgi:hypothetical protein
MKEAVGTKVRTADLRKVPMSQTSGTFQDGLSVPPPLLGPLLLARTTSGVRESDVRPMSADSAIIPPGGICHTLDRAKWVRALSLLVLPAMLLTGCTKSRTEKEAE